MRKKHPQQEIRGRERSNSTKFDPIDDQFQPKWTRSSETPAGTYGTGTGRTGAAAARHGGAVFGRRRRLQVLCGRRPVDAVRGRDAHRVEDAPPAADPLTGRAGILDRGQRLLLGSDDAAAARRRTSLLFVIVVVVVVVVVVERVQSSGVDVLQRQLSSQYAQRSGRPKSKFNFLKLGTIRKSFFKLFWVTAVNEVYCLVQSNQSSLI